MAQPNNSNQVPLLESAEAQAEIQWMRHVIDQGMVFAVIAFSCMGSNTVYPHQAEMHCFTAAAFLCFLVAKYKLGKTAEKCFATVGFTATSMLVCIAMIPNSITSISIYLEVFVACAASIPLVLPFVWALRPKDVHERHNWVADEDWKQAWAAVAVTLFTVVGGGEKIASDTCVAILTTCGGVAYILLLEVLFIDSTHLAARSVVCFASFLQVPMVIATMFVKQFKDEELKTTLLILGGSFALGMWMVAVKWDFISMEKGKKWFHVAVARVRNWFNFGWNWFNLGHVGVYAIVTVLGGVGYMLLFEGLY